VEISVNISDGLSVRIQDNGRGFNEENIRPFSNGISNMRKRVANLGGRFEIHNNKGSTVFFAIPLP
jgi:signal transduction histidine kinase